MWPSAAAITSTPPAMVAFDGRSPKASHTQTGASGASCALIGAVSAAGTSR